MIDDIGTTGNSLLSAIKALKEAKITVESAFIIINRLEGVRKNLEVEKVRLYEITDIFTISNILHNEKVLDDQTLSRIKNRRVSKIQQIFQISSHKSLVLFLLEEYASYVLIYKHQILFLHQYIQVCQRQITILQF